MFKREARRIMREGLPLKVYGGSSAANVPYLIMPGSGFGKCTKCGCGLHMACDTRNPFVIVDAEGWPHAEAFDA